MLSHEFITTENQPILVTELIKTSSSITWSGKNHCQIAILKLFDGIQLMYWYSQFAQEHDMQLEDDSDNIYFSFNLNLDGMAQCRFKQSNDYAEYDVFQGCGVISYHPTHRGSYIQEGILENLTLIVDKTTLPELISNHEQLLSQLSTQEGYIANLYLPELYATARQLYDEMGTADSIRNHLWFQGKGLVFASLFMDCLSPQSNVHRISMSDQCRLFTLKNDLLANLSHPPTIAQLAKTYGFSASTLTRNFRRVFGCSIHEMLQRERMEIAHHKLLHSEANVTQVATKMTAPSDVGRKTFQPRRINWS